MDAQILLLDDNSDPCYKGRSISCKTLGNVAQRLMSLARPFKAGILREWNQPSRQRRLNGAVSMANTYNSLHYHIIFSTKNREPWLKPDIEQRIWAFIGGIARAHKMTALQIGGIEDHVQSLVTAPATIAPAQIAQYLKGDSSKWDSSGVQIAARFRMAGWLRRIHGEQVKHSPRD